MPPESNDIKFPLGGQSKRMGYQNQEPYTFIESENVRPEDVFERRQRGGNRPGLIKSFTEVLGDGNPVRLLDSVRTGQELDPSSSFDDPFDGSSLQSGWSLWSYANSPVLSTVPVLPTVGSGAAYLRSGGDHVAAIRDAISWNTGASVELEVQLYRSGGFQGFKDESSGSTLGTRWRVAIGLDSATDWNNAVVVQWANVNSSGTRTFDIGVYNQGALLLGEQMPLVSGDVARLVLQPSGVLQIYLGMANNLVYAVSGIDMTNLSDQVAFGVWHPSGALRDTGYKYFNFSYTPSAAATPIAEPAIIASANGSLYYEDSSSSLALVTGQNVNLASDRRLSSAERFGKLYIADYEVRAATETGATADTGGGAYTTFNDPTYDTPASPDWTGLGIDPDGDMLEIISATGGDGTEIGQYVIGTVATTGLTLATEPFNGPLSDVKYRIVRAPKVFDYRLAGAGKLVRMTATGTTQVPLGCRLIAVWNDRIVLSGDPENPGDTFMSKQGSPLVWDEDTSLGSAIFGEFDVNVRLDEPVTALIPFVRNYLVFGATESIHVLRGNPVAGGGVDAVSTRVGVLDMYSWCITPEGILIVMTGNGLYAIDPNATVAEPVSSDRLPNSFFDLDLINSDIELAFDVRRNGIVIAVTPASASQSINYWFDWTTKTFWPEAYRPDHDIMAMHSYTQSGESTPTLVLGGRDGYLREHRESQGTDDGLELTSTILIGPILLGGSGYYGGFIREIIGQLSQSSASVKVEIQVGNSMEDAYRATPRFTTWLRPGRSLSHFPRLRGNCCFIRLTGTDRWAYEELTIVRERLGKQRLLA